VDTPDASLGWGYIRNVPVVLIAVGVLLWLLALGLAFTIFGIVSALLGFACIVAGAIWLAAKGIRRAATHFGAEQHE
jgi:hypothetical protein